MKIENNLAAKIMGEILSRGMSLCDVDIKSAVNSDAIDALCEIKNAVLCEKEAGEKISDIQNIMEKYMIL